jgi:hypothetical protein
VWLRSKGTNGEFDNSSPRSSIQRNMKQPTDSTCRMCCKAEEHIKHTVAGCATLAPSEYTNWHNQLAGSNHWTICIHMVLQVTERCCGHVPDRVINVNGTTIIWDVPANKNRIILPDRPDMVLHDKNRRLAC